MSDIDSGGGFSYTGPIELAESPQHAARVLGQFPLPRLIGIGGRLASGKDTVADYLVEHHGFVKLGMSDPLLDAALALNPIVDQSTYRPVASGDYLRLSVLVKQVGYTEAKKNLEVRRFLQVLGTEVGRNMIDENVWVDMAGRQIDKLRAEGKPVVITGLRFPNELEMIESREGSTWWVERSNEDISVMSLHASEASLTGREFDALINNYGTLAQLFAQVEERLNPRKPRHGVALTTVEALELEQALHADFPTAPISIITERLSA